MTLTDVDARRMLILARRKVRDLEKAMARRPLSAFHQRRMAQDLTYYRTLARRLAGEQ